VPVLNIAGQRFPNDDGSADPGCASALAAYAAGLGGEHAALTMLATSRLLVPVVARAGQNASEMALPTLIGNDGRPALPAFTCLDALGRWRRDARPVPVAASQVWQAAAQEEGAVIIDVAGPVPLAVDGTRLAALAQGRPVPPPHADPDVRALVAAAVAREEDIDGFWVLPAAHGGDIALHLCVAADGGAARGRQMAARCAEVIMARAGGSLRRGVEVTLSEAGGGR
jgi:SseB protein N-terminal domain